MGLFDFLVGGSKTKTTQDQTQDSFGYSVNKAGSSSLSGATSTGRSAGTTGSQATSSSQARVFGADLIDQLRRGSLTALGNIDPGMAGDRVNQLFTGGSALIDKLTGGGAGEKYLEGRLSGDNSDILDAQISALGDDLGSFLSDEINPVLTGNAVSAGQLGGGRQGVAQGAATKNILKEFATQAANLRATDITNRDSAALGLLDVQGRNAGTALGALPALQGIGSGAGALDPYLAVSQIFGDNTVLADSTSQSTSFGQEMSEQQANEFASSLAEELGISYDEAHAIMKSTSKGSSTNGLLPALGSLIPGSG